MDVRFTEEQELLRRSVREFLGRECPIARTRELAKDPQGFSDELWKKMAELGWMGLTLPEEHGGAGLGALELAVVLEEMGRVLLPGPFFSTVALGARAVELAGSDEQKARILPGVAAGRLRVTLAWLEEQARWDADGIALPARREGEGFRLTGAKRFVPDAHAADLLVVPVRTGGHGAEGVTLLLVEAKASGIELRHIAYTDETRRPCEVRFADTAVAGSALLGAVGAGWPVLERLLDYARVALCAETCGGAQRVLEMSVAFAKTRQQFGRPIGSFQAIGHSCADMFLRVEGARSSTYYAAWALANEEPDAHVAACMAKAFCSDAYRDVASAGIQVHGGLGFTWEQHLHLYYKRAKDCELTFGDARWHRELIARELLDEKPA